MAIEGYFITHPSKFCFWILLLSLIIGKKVKFNDWCELSSCKDFNLDALNDHWRVRFSFTVIRILTIIAAPMKSLGKWIELVLNVLSSNGGLFGTILNIFKGNLVIPRRDTEDFLSLVGLLDHRVSLYNGDEIINDNGANNSYGRKCYADLCAMASTLVYENEFVVKNRVTKQWKMHYLDFYNFWDDHLKRRSTQAFIFCDREVDAQLVVLAFRGTEIFNADDWKSDLDISWVKIPGVGKIHMGFMEALGLASRYQNDIVKRLDRESNQDPDRPLAYYTLVRKLHELMQTHKNAKLILTGHSLGGALAVLFFGLLNMQKETDIFERIVVMYTFGQPRVGDEEFGRFMDSKLSKSNSRYYRVVYCNDLAPRLPYDDHIFLFKHFGTCLYFNSLYHEKNCKDEPNRNFSPLYFLPIRINAMWEIMMCGILPWIKGPSYRQSKLCIAMRMLLGPLLPGVVSHCMVNYINAIRLGPSELKP